MFKGDFKKILVVLIVLILVSGCNGTGGITVDIKDSTPQTTQKTSTNTIKDEIKDCPYECCLDTSYKRKDCNSGYDCLNNKCIAKDTDGDGLSDVEEQSYGTSSTSADTDNDGLTDYVEVKQKGTNPTKANTDGDRYNDNEDSNPLVKNSAKVDVNIVNSVEEPNIINIGLLTVAIAGVILSEGALTPVLGQFSDKVLYSYNVDLEIKNNGNDYSNYANFDLVYKLSGTEVKRESVSLEKLNVDESSSKHFRHDIKPLEILEALIIMGGAGQLGNMKQWTASIEGVEYEKF